MGLSLCHCLIKIIVLVFLIGNIEAESEQCKSASVKSMYLLLKQKLLCNYDKDERPRNNPDKNVTTIDVDIYPIFLEFVK